MSYLICKYDIDDIKSIADDIRELFQIVFKLLKMTLRLFQIIFSLLTITFRLFQIMFVSFQVAF